MDLQHFYGKGPHWLLWSGSRAAVSDILNRLNYSVVFIVCMYEGGSRSFRPDTKSAPNGKCCEGYIAPSMVRLMHQYVLK
jgi:hypothetical protein